MEHTQDGQGRNHTLYPNPNFISRVGPVPPHDAGDEQGTISARDPVLKTSKRFRAANVVFTLFRSDLERTFDQVEADNYLSRFSQQEYTVFAVFQLEECPDTGRLHLQGYAESTKLLSRLQWQGLLGPGFFARRRGTQAQAISYCTKSETRISGPFKYGSPKETNQGTRTDIHRLVAHAIDGSGIDTVLADCAASYMRYFKGYDRIVRHGRKRKQQEIVEKIISGELTVPPVTYIYGDTSVGKTFYVYKTEGPKNVFELTFGDGTKNSIWWDGIEDEKVLLLDDFYGQCKLSYALKMFRPYLFRAQTKGGFDYPVWSKIYVTSNRAPTELYPRLVGTKEWYALQSRFTKVIHMQEKQY